jgi:hypothetical protein
VLRRHHGQAAWRRGGRPAVSTRLTSRSSREVGRTTSRPPTASAAHCGRQRPAHASSSPFTSMRSAWNVRLAGCHRCGGGGRMLVRTSSASARSSERVAGPLPHHSVGESRANRSSPYVRSTRARSARRIGVDDVSGGDTSLWSMRMSSARPARRRSRARLVELRDDTPRSKRMPCTRASRVRPARREAGRRRRAPASPGRRRPPDGWRCARAPAGHGRGRRAGRAGAVRAARRCAHRGPTVASTTTASGACSAGASRARQRSRSTGT